MAMMNSGRLNAPRCSVSAKFHILPNISFGSLAFSNICFAVSPVYVHLSLLIVSDSVIAALPAKMPFTAPDFSNSAAYSAAFSGVKGGTRMAPLCCG